MDSTREADVALQAVAPDHVINGLAHIGANNNTTAYAYAA